MSHKRQLYKDTFSVKDALDGPPLKKQQRIAAAQPSQLLKPTSGISKVDQGQQPATVDPPVKKKRGPKPTDWRAAYEKAFNSKSEEERKALEEECSKPIVPLSAPPPSVVAPPPKTARASYGNKKDSKITEYLKYNPKPPQLEPVLPAPVTPADLPAPPSTRRLRPFCVEHDIPPALYEKLKNAGFDIDYKDAILSAGPDVWLVWEITNAERDLVLAKLAQYWDPALGRLLKFCKDFNIAPRVAKKLQDMAFDPTTPLNTLIDQEALLKAGLTEAESFTFASKYNCYECSHTRTFLPLNLEGDHTLRTFCLDYHFTASFDALVNMGFSIDDPEGMEKLPQRAWSAFGIGPFRRAGIIGAHQQFANMLKLV